MNSWGSSLSSLTPDSSISPPPQTWGPRHSAGTNPAGRGIWPNPTFPAYRTPWVPTTPSLLLSWGICVHTRSINVWNPIGQTRLGTQNEGTLTFYQTTSFGDQSWICYLLSYNNNNNNNDNLYKLFVLYCD